jgi:hypothetical protein
MMTIRWLSQFAGDRQRWIQLLLFSGLGALMITSGCGQKQPVTAPALTEEEAPAPRPENLKVATSDIEAARLSDLWGRVLDKWRADIKSAQATERTGVIPPMLEVEEAGAFVRVTNIGKKQICLRLTRVARNSTRPNDVARCVLDSETCREIAPGHTQRFQLFRAGNAPDCYHALLEFRVGTPLAPEPTWWSASALEEFDVSPRPGLPGELNQPGEMAATTEKLNALLVESDRAARWKRELAKKSRR